MSKLALKGLKAVRLWPVLKNDKDAYEVGAMVEVTGAQALTKEIQRNEYTIYADDDVYDTGSDYQYETLNLTMAELPLSIEALLSGGTYDDATKTYSFKNIDTAPEFAMGYAGFKLDKTYRMYKHYAVKLMSVSVNHNTRGNDNSIQPYTLVLRNTQRKIDGMIRDTRDSEDDTYTWLDTLDNLP